MSLEAAEHSIVAGTESVVESPLFLKGLLVVGGAALLIGGFRYLYRKALGG